MDEPLLALDAALTRPAAEDALAARVVETGTTTRYKSGDDPETVAAVENVADGTAKARFADWTTAVSYRPCSPLQPWPTLRAHPLDGADADDRGSSTSKGVCPCSPPSASP